MEKTGYGANFYFKKGGTTWTKVAAVMDVSPPKRAREDAEVSNHDLNWDQFIPGMRSGGEPTLKFAMDTSNTALADFMETFDDDDVYDMAIVLTQFAGAEAGEYKGFSFSGYVKSVEPGTPIKDTAVWDIPIKISGAVTYGDLDPADLDA